VEASEVGLVGVGGFVGSIFGPAEEVTGDCGVLRVAAPIGLKFGGSFAV
jgi:hypothetical protein